MNKYEELIAIISSSSEFVEFADFGNGVSVDWINKAEARLGFTLPDSYKWWLEMYGGGEIYGDEVFSIYEQDFDLVVGGDIVFNYELNIKSNNYDNNKLVVCETEDDVFYFNLSDRNNDGELGIYSLNDGDSKYADDFISFLKKRILE